jgi:hypothetical protein
MDGPLSQKDIDTIVAILVEKGGDVLGECRNRTRCGRLRPDDGGCREQGGARCDDSNGRAARSKNQPEDRPDLLPADLPRDELFKLHQVCEATGLNPWRRALGRGLDQPRHEERAAHQR